MSLEGHSTLMFLVFLPTCDPTSFSLKQLLDEMCGPTSDRTDWPKPLRFSLYSAEEEAKRPSKDGGNSKAGSSRGDAPAPPLVILAPHS
ncbi:hypothetical protein E2C01_052191 [Portunus trituberculatus]|uniref:Uncharacterized protein n=1 Tax=Portunus trituberculatus TaxID=210409 RepID=A0A5B7GKW7_PORTR|nr:hypothetical protein [Portunus trituberculatus]